MDDLSLNSTAEMAGRERSAFLARTAAAVGGGDPAFRAALDALPTAVYLTDPDGVVTYYNRLAAALWGHRPALGAQRWSGFQKLFWPNGKALPAEDAPMAVALRERRQVRGLNMIAERCDGVRVVFLSYPTPIFDASGELIGAVDMLVDASEQRLADDHARRLASIVESSQDAIVGEDLAGLVVSWNGAAERMFGYSLLEMIGQSTKILIPPELEVEDQEIVERLCRGERVECYETVRRGKDGGRVDISLSVSPIRNAAGAIIGVSKIARDITERRLAREQQQLLLDEMNHRMKNLFSLARGVVNLSARSARTPAELAESVGDRLEALSRAQALTLAAPGAPVRGQTVAMLHALIRTIVWPYEPRAAEAAERVTVRGGDVALGRDSLTSLALLLNELTTNAAKYGAFSRPEGRVAVDCQTSGDQFLLTWTERGGPAPSPKVQAGGFGGTLIKAAIEGQLGGAIARDWSPEGLTIRLSLAADRLTR